MDSDTECRCCGVLNPITEYHMRRGERVKKCKTCQAVVSKKRRDKHLAWLWDIKQTAGCTDCGYNESPVALQFDHINDDKKFGIGNGRCRSLKSLQAEIDKCEVVCANCHHIRTYTRVKEAQQC